MWRSKLLLAGVAALAISTATLSPAQAEYGWHLDKVDYFDDDGDWVEFWSDGEGHTLIFVIEDGETIGYIADGFDNPNPEEGSGSKSDWDNLTDILKKHGAGLERITNLAGTPLGDILLRGGNLIDPYHNPADVGYEDGGGYGSGGGGFTPGNGSPTEQLKRHAGKGNKSKGDGEDGDDLKRGEVGLFDDDMPGPPDIVNPNPTSHSFKLGNGGQGREGSQGGAGSGGAGSGGAGSGGGGGAAGAAR